MNQTIAFVGAGNMARSIIGGMVKQGTPPSNIRVSAPSVKNLTALQHDFGVSIGHSNADAVNGADTVVLAVKPQVMKSVCLELANHIRADALVLSIAAGITCDSLSNWLQGSRPLIRCMPNTPSLIGLGASGLFADQHVTNEQKRLVEHMLGAVGIVAWVGQEALIDAVTAVSGSGPAYFFLMLEAMVEAGVAQGLTEEAARTLAIQTARGASELALQSDVSLADLRRRVTSPGGTTERAISRFENSGLRGIVKEAMADCAARARELALQLGK